MHNELLPFLTENNTCCTPGEIVHAPKGVERQEEGECWNGKDVEDHPPDHVPLASKYKDQRLQAINSSDHDEREEWDAFVLSNTQVDEVDNLIAELC